jgi:autotransporter-associated beta strand protein
MDGGSLTARGTITVSADKVVAGVHAGSASDGSAFGAGFFLNGSGTIRFSPTIGHTERVFDAIDDEAGVVAKGYTPLAGFTPGSYSLVKSGLGTLVLSADNAYSGGTILKLGTLDLKAICAAGVGDITFAAHSQATLQITNAALSNHIFSNPIDAFGNRDTLDLSGIHFHAGAKATYNTATHDLTVHSGHVTDTLTLLSPHGTHFEAASDHHGGTDVFLVFA